MGIQERARRNEEEKKHVIRRDPFTGFLMRASGLFNFFITAGAAASTWFRGTFRKYIPYPTALGPIEDGFALAVFECRV